MFAYLTTDLDKGYYCTNTSQSEVLEYMSTSNVPRYPYMAGFWNTDGGQLGGPYFGKEWMLIYTLT